MKVDEFTTKVIKAEPGKFLTQIDETISIDKRIVADTLAIGKNDSADNYKEINQEEANRINEEKEEYRKKLEKEAYIKHLEKMNR